MAEIFYDKDADLNLLQDKTIAVIGFGSQGHAHALNLHESGCNVVVGLRSDSSSRAEAEKHGVKVVEPAEAAKMGDLIMILMPDELHPQIYKEQIEPGLHQKRERAPDPVQNRVRDHSQEHHERVS